MKRLDNEIRARWKNLMVLFYIILSAGISLNAQQRPVIPGENHSHECSRTQYHKQVKKSKLKSAKKGFEPIGIIHQSNQETHSTKSLKATCQYSQSQIASLSSTDLVAYLKSDYDYECVGRLLFEYSGYTSQIFSNAKIQAVCNNIRTYASSYDGTFNSGMYGLWIYLHVARYMEFFHPTDVTLNSSSLSVFELACEAMANSGHLFDQNAEAYKILGEFLTSLDNDGIRHKASTFSVVKTVMQHLTTIDSWKQITSDEDMLAYAGAYNQIFFLMFRGTGSPGQYDQDFLNSLLNDPQFTSLLFNVGKDTEIASNDDLKFISGNAVLELTRMAHLPGLIGQLEGYYNQIANTYPRLSVNWLNAVIAINDYGDCGKYNLCEDKDGLIAEVEAYLFPNKYSFDDGKLIVRTPMNSRKVQNLYHAVKQVQSHLFRMIETDVPVDGDVNESLNLIVFGDNDQYVNYATFLYGIATNNGGMYIEKGATFYTFDREYGLSLEALFRHEYAHYLQGRYMIPGYWGENSFYDNNRLVWFEEGSAEFFAGGTDTDGVKLLAQSGNRIKNEGPDYVTLNAVLNASYSDGDFIHYRYGNALWYMWYLNDFGKFKTLTTLTRANDVSGFDNIINPLKSSSSAEADWQNFLGQITDGTVSVWEPETDWLEDRQLSAGTPEDIKNEFVAAGGSQSTVSSIDFNAINKRFKLEGQISASGGARGLGNALDNLMLNVRQNSELNNLDYTVGYIKNINGSTANYVVTGPLRNPNVSEDADANFVAYTLATIEGGQISFENKSTGYLTNHSWTLQGATPSTSNEANPTVSYNTAGVYNAGLTVTGKNGSSDTETKPAYIKVYAKGNATYCSANVVNDYTFIRRVQLANIDNVTNGFPTNGYADFSSTVVTELSRGANYQFTVEPDYTNATSMGVGVWIDWNQDGDFEDVNEQVYGSLVERYFNATGSFTVPQTALAGGTRMRVRLSYKGTIPVPCGEDSYMGEVEDYSIIVINGQISTPPPVALFSADVNYIIREQSISFSDESINSPSTWQWSFEGGTPATSTEQNVSVSYANAGTYLVSLTVENASGRDTYLDYITVGLGGGIGGEYCDATNDRDDVHINNVSLNTIDNSTGFSVNGYGDYTNINTELEDNVSYNLSVSTTQNWSLNELSAWIDWNQDGDFTDNGEKILTGSGANSPYSSSFSIPAGAKSGGTRMRVRLGYGSSPSPCGNDGIGETEDYIVYVNTTGGDIEAPPPPSNLVSSNITQTSFDLSWTASIDNVAVTGYDIYQDDLFIKTVIGTATSTSITGLVANTSYVFTIKAKDAAGNVSVTSNSLSITTLPNNDDGGPLSNGMAANGNMDQTDDSDMWYIDVAPNALSMEVILVCSGSDFDTYGKAGAEPTKSVYDWRGYTSGGEENTINNPQEGRHYIMVDHYSGSGAYTLKATIIYEGIDAEAPTAPSNLTASNITANGLDLSWSASTDNVGVTAYEVSQGGAVVQTVTGTSVSISGLSPNSDYTYSVKAKDAANNISPASNTVSVTTSGDVPPVYCNAGASDGPEHIARVQFANIDNSSVRTSYSDYTSISASLTAGNSYALTVTIGDVYNGDKATSWIDWNTDGDFDDAGEKFSLSVSGSTATANITVPSTVTAGSKRLRVRVFYYAAGDNPCGTQTYGEVEDYTVIVNSSAAGATLLAGPMFTAKVYPNPTSEKLNVLLLGADNGKIQLINMNGQTVLNKKLDGQKTQIDISAHKKGMYLLRITSGQEMIKQKLIIH